MKGVSNIEDAPYLDKYLQGLKVVEVGRKESLKMIDKTSFQAFEDRIERLAIAIVVTLLGSSILGFALFLAELP